MNDLGITKCRKNNRGFLRGMLIGLMLGTVLGGCYVWGQNDTARDDLNFYQAEYQEWLMIINAIEGKGMFPPLPERKPK